MTLPLSRILILSRRFKSYSPHGGGSEPEKPTVVPTSSRDIALLKQAGLTATTEKPAHTFHSLSDLVSALPS